MSRWPLPSRSKASMNLSASPFLNYYSGSYSLDIKIRFYGFTFEKNCKSFMDNISFIDRVKKAICSVWFKVFNSCKSQS
jgi:hypothetical protein